MPYEVVRRFEETIADWAGAKYGVAVSSCTNAIFLCCQFRRPLNRVIIPRRTYPGVAASIIHAGGWIDWGAEPWYGVYSIHPTGIVDSALQFRQGMYMEELGDLHCLSFHSKKQLPIGRGGMILTDNSLIAGWLRRARYDGRQEVPLNEDVITMLGWNMIMTPADAARGLELFQHIKDKDIPDLKFEDQNYPDLSKFEVFNRRPSNG